MVVCTVQQYGQTRTKAKTKSMDAIAGSVHGGKRGHMTEDEAKARWICCPLCDKERCERGADDCDVKKYLQRQEEKNK